ncbi:MAG: malonyl-CoA decarboxylase [Alphaproteobacteria bacterium]|nr:malonyl-CoA decarboxylase [Alphaproteobacteria bacterium SS10]
MAAARLFDFLNTIAEQGRTILGADPSTGRNVEQVITNCHRLLSSRGEAAEIALAFAVLDSYRRFDEEEKTSFFDALLWEFAPDSAVVKQAADSYLKDPTPTALTKLNEATTPRRQALLEHLNPAPNATMDLVRMRADLIDRLRANPELKAVDDDFAHVFGSWFNKGFLELRRIDWQMPAALLEKLIEYEAVHGMAGWRDLRKRILPPDRMIYGFFHPQLEHEPLIFVEVALTTDMPNEITGILEGEREYLAPEKATTAVFYSISNCQTGLRGVPLGNFLIKQVVEDVRAQFPTIKQFVTLSPLPSLRRWVEKLEPGIEADADNLMSAAAHYLLEEKARGGKPQDPVARFHLGNGARLERINWAANPSDDGQSQSFGIMVNYLYKLDQIEVNHEAYANDGKVTASTTVQKAAKQFTQAQGAS